MVRRPVVDKDEFPLVPFKVLVEQSVDTAFDIECFIQERNDHRKDHDRIFSSLTSLSMKATDPHTIPVAIIK